MSDAQATLGKLRAEIQSLNATAAEGCSIPSRLWPQVLLPGRPALLLVSVEGGTLGFCRAVWEEPAQASGLLGCPGHGPATVPCMFPQVPPEVWAADEQDRLLLLEPEEFLQGVV